MTLGVGEEPCGVGIFGISFEGDFGILRGVFDLDDSSSDKMTCLVSIFTAD